MRRSFPSLAQLLAVVFLVVVSTGLALAQAPVSFPLEPAGGSTVSGTVVLTAHGAGTQAVVDVAGLAPGTKATVSLHAGSCAAPGASAALLPELMADATGKASATGRVLFRGTDDVALTDIADGGHIIAVSGSGGIVACGTIPHFAAADSSPLPATGAARPWLPSTLLLAVGILALGAGIRLGMRRNVERRRP